jgi:hypothetical protein
MPWENTEKTIRSGHRAPEEFQEDTLKTITLSEKEGIQAIVGKPKGKHTMETQSYLFSKDKGWTVESAKEWFDTHYFPAKEHVCAVLPFVIAEKIMDKPLRIRGLAMTIGMSRNFNIYTPKELQSFAGKLVDAPVYMEHVTAQNAVGKVTKTGWDGQNLLYEAEIYDEDTAAKIRKGLISHVSVGADYETIDLVNGKIPHGLYNAEMSLVAVPGVAETNIQILEKLQLKEQEFEPILTGEYTLGFYQETAAFMPEHFSTVWIDRENAILAIMGKPKNQPELQRTQAIFFSKEKMWDQNKIRDWLSLHPSYMTPISTPTTQSGNAVSESLIKKPSEPKIPVSQAIKLIEEALPSHLVQRSWSLGPQRMCQELNRVLLKLRSLQDGHNIDRK